MSKGLWKNLLYGIMAQVGQERANHIASLCRLEYSESTLTPKCFFGTNSDGDTGLIIILILNKRTRENALAVGNEFIQRYTARYQQGETISFVITEDL